MSAIKEHIISHFSIGSEGWEFSGVVAIEDGRISISATDNNSIKTLSYVNVLILIVANKYEDFCIVCKDDSIALFGVLCTREANKNNNKMTFSTKWCKLVKIDYAVMTYFNKLCGYGLRDSIKMSSSYGKKYGRQ